VADIDIDRQAAAAEFGLDRVDAAGDTGVADTGPDTVEAIELGSGMHVADLDASPYDVDGDVDEVGHAVAEASETLDTLVDAFNARDLEAIAELCVPDCETPGLAVGFDELLVALPDLWTRRPTVMMTRTVHDGQALGVVWERGENDDWVGVGTVHIDLDGDSRLQVIGFSDDLGLLDELASAPPDGDLDEGDRWAEWEEGAG
jgi:hypothetical protein